MNTGIEKEQDLFSPRVLDHEADENIIRGRDSLFNLIEEGAFDSDLRFYLKTEAYSLQLAYANNKILSLSNSRTRILAHQVESTYRIINSLNQRFLIADEVGLGKTVEAGLVIKELVYRHDYKRILIVCPASLLLQWQNEMLSKFNEHFTIMDRRVMNKVSKRGSSPGNPWNAVDRVICSIDFIKNQAFEKDIKNCKWDAVIFDEAHRLRRDSNQATQAFSVAEIISRRTKSLLLLSATPFRGKLEELYFLTSLLDRNILGPLQTFQREYCMEDSDLSTLRRKISPVVIRRTKKEVGGFTRRFASTIKFELYEDERMLYDETTHYVIEEFNRALQTENRAVGFVMTVFQKLLDSSSHALHCALSRRLARLSELARRSEAGPLLEKDLNCIDVETLSEEENVEEAVSIYSGKTLEELKKEIATLERLVAMSENIEKNKKGERLKSLIRKLKKEGRVKILIFTQFRTTQDYLEKILGQWDVEIFNGSMNRDQKENAIVRFKDEAEILIATEAGGEGRNMQFCNILINYDLPWSPLRVEQRIGRIHRFGQKDDVFIYNFSTRGTVAERVLDILQKKLHIFEETIGTPDILLGQVEDELQLNKLFMEMASGSKDSQVIDSEIDGRIDAARKSYEKLSQLTLTNRMDFNYDEYYRVTLKERKFSNVRIEHFIDHVIEEDLGASNHIEKLKDSTNTYRVTVDGGEWAIEKQGTFDSNTALGNENLEFLAFGHPVVDSLVKGCQDMSFGGLTGMRAIRHDIFFQGMIFFYMVTFRSNTETGALIPVAVSPGSGLDDFDLEEIEQECIDQDYHDVPPVDSAVITGISGSADTYFAEAEKRIVKKINDRILDITDNLDIKIDPELEKIKFSFERKLEELREKLHLQEAQMKWYGREMKGAITRTRNLIVKAEQERDRLLEQYRGYMGITYTAQLVNAGILVTL